jgi:hypothetical protein
VNSPITNIFDLELNFFIEHLNMQHSLFTFEEFLPILGFLNYSDYGILILNGEISSHSKSLIAFINQTDDLNLFNNLENIKTIYHYSIPNTKLAYPEPFIASASFMHTDL